MFNNATSRMKQSALVFLASAVMALTLCAEAHAGHWVFQCQGINSCWVYVPDDSDNSAYTWNGESSGPSQPYQAATHQPSLHDASAAMVPRVTPQQIRAEQAARIRYNQAQLQQGSTNFKPTLLSGYRHH